MHPLTAVIYLPAAIALDGVYARQCVEHLTRRHYKLLCIARDWEIVDRFLTERKAQVVILARREHLDPDATPRIEIVGQETRDCRPDVIRDSAGRTRPGRRPRQL